MCCLLVLDSVNSTLQRIRQPKTQGTNFLELLSWRKEAKTGLPPTGRVALLAVETPAYTSFSTWDKQDSVEGRVLEPLVDRTLDQRFLHFHAHRVLFITLGNNSDRDPRRSGHLAAGDA